MTAIEIEPRIGDTDHDDLPIGHLPDKESFEALLRGERPTRAMCGAELLGIPAGDVPFRRCEECDRLAFGYSPN